MNDFGYIYRVMYCYNDLSLKHQPSHTLRVHAQHIVVLQILRISQTTCTSSTRDPTMCAVHYWRCRTCQHRWLTIKKPCQPGRGFNNCPTFKTRQARHHPPVEWAPAGSCPGHELKGSYDYNTVRLIKKDTQGGGARVLVTCADVENDIEWWLEIRTRATRSGCRW